MFVSKEERVVVVVCVCIGGGKRERERVSWLVCSSMEMEGIDRIAAVAVDSFHLASKQ